jgi:hypothetical protein
MAPSLLRSKGNLITISAAATTAVSAAAPTTIATAASASPASLDLGTGFINVQRPPADLSAVQRCNGFFSVFCTRHLHKAESARASGVPVSHNADPVHLPVYLEKLSQFIFRSVEVEVPNENVLHANCL